MSANLDYAQGLGRAGIGALLFGLPLFMTSEMWAFAFTVHPWRLAALLGATFPVLVGLSYFAGFERTVRVLDDVLDALAAMAVAAAAGAAALVLFGVIRPGQPLEEIVAKIAVVTFPGAIGALLADKQLGQDEEQSEGHDQRGFGARLFLMGVGALFVALNVAPTEEMMLIAFQISPWQALALALASLALLHALLFWIDFPGRDARRGEKAHWLTLTSHSFAAYGLCLLISVALLWAFGRTEGTGIFELTEFAIVLAFAGAVGAGVAQLVVAERRA